jgi:hypothetical protein
LSNVKSAGTLSFEKKNPRKLLRWENCKIKPFASCHIRCGFYLDNAEEENFISKMKNYMEEKKEVRTLQSTQ